MRPKRGESPGRSSGPKCLRCERGPAYHGGHERRDPKCVLFGYGGTDLKDLNAYTRRKRIEGWKKQLGEAPGKAPLLQYLPQPPQRRRCRHLRQGWRPVRKSHAQNA